MDEPVRDRQTDDGHLVVGQRGSVQMVVQRAQRVVVRDEPQLGARVPRGHVRPDVAEDVLVAEQDRAGERKRHN